MSGNAHQRKQARDKLLELDRRQRAELDARTLELEQVRSAHVAELANVRAGYEQQLAEMQQRYAADIESWARASRADADMVAMLREELATVYERATGAEEQLHDMKAAGLISKAEHEAGIEAATAKLRERLRRAQAERLAPKKVVLEHVARGEQSSDAEVTS